VSSIPIPDIKTDKNISKETSKLKCTMDLESVQKPQRTSINKVKNNKHKGT
jgi:hypothetical protein